MQHERKQIEIHRGCVDVKTRLTEVNGAWRKMRPKKVFYGMTLREFETAVQPFRDAIAEIADLKTRLRHAFARRNAQAAEAKKVVKGVVAAVRGDRAEGEDGELYCAMGYIPMSRRKRSSARSRKEESPSRDSDTG